MTEAPSVFVRTVATPALLILLIAAITVAAWSFGSGTLQRTVVEMLIRVTLVVGIWIFVGNSGIISFGHIGFMCLGAYAAAWFTIPPMLKEITLRGLPEFVRASQFPFWPSALAASLLPAVVAAVLGPILMRLAGIAASIATFAMLAVINTVYSNWSTVTGGTSSIVGIPVRTDVWLALGVASGAIAVAYLYAISRSGLALRAARDEAIAAQASGVHIERERTIAFVISAFVCGAAGVLYAHFLGIVTPDAFFLTATFVALSMLVVGGINSLSGAVIGVVLISTIIQLLRWMERGVAVGDTTLSIPSGSQEIAIGIVMIVILVFRPAGLMGGREIGLPRMKGAAAAAEPKAAE